MSPENRSIGLVRILGQGSEIDVIWLESIFSLGDGRHNLYTEDFLLPRWQNNSFLFQTQEPRKPSWGHLLFAGTHAI